MHNCGWYRTTVFSLFSFLSLESCESPSCPNSDPASAALYSPGFGNCRLKFHGVLKTDARKTSRLLYCIKKEKEIKKEHHVPICASHIFFFAITAFAPCFQSIVLRCSSGAIQLTQALLKCSCFWGGTEWLGAARNVLCSCRNCSCRLSCCSDCLGLCQPLHQLSWIAATV